MGSLFTGRARYVSIVAIVALASAFLMTRASVVGASNVKPYGSYVIVGFPLFEAIACWWCAARVGGSAKMRAQWLLMGAGGLAFGLGQFLEEFVYFNPTDGITVAKVLFLLAIVFFGTGVWLALRSFDGFLNTRRPLRIALTAAAITTVIGVIGVGDIFSELTVPLAAKVLLALYPIGLIWLMAMPALALALTVSQMGSGTLARPWWAIFTGVTLLFVANVILIILTATDAQITNAGPMEMGWAVGLSLIAVGAAMQIDAQNPSPAVGA